VATGLVCGGDNYKKEGVTKLLRVYRHFAKYGESGFVKGRKALWSLVCGYNVWEGIYLKIFEESYGGRGVNNNCVEFIKCKGLYKKKVDS
jgi:hypothetical protein